MKAGWTVAKLRDVVTLNYGKSLEKERRDPDGNVPVYGANGVMDWSYCQLTHGPSLVIGRKGSAGEITRVDGSFWPSDVTYYTTHDSSRLNFDYMHYALRTLDLPSMARGVKPGINRNDVYDLTIPLPPLEQQHQIVAVLDEAFEGLARARAHAAANLQNARELFEGFLTNLFSTSSGKSCTLPEIAENLDRVRVPITKSERVAGDVPYFGASGVVDHVAGHLFDEDLLLVSEDGANLLARTYPIAFSISGKSWVNNHAHVLRFSDLDTQEYVRLYLNSISLEPFVSGMAQPKLNQAQLNRIPIPFPSATERAEIVARAELFSAKTADLEDHYAASLADLEGLRQSLLQKAFAGELT